MSQLKDLVEKLNKFEVELIYNKIQNDIRAKYTMVQEFYVELEEMRKELIRSGNLTHNSKAELARKLDEIVPHLRKNFTQFTEEKYALLDEIFLIKTNNIKWNYNELEKRVDALLTKPELIYKEEFGKIDKICALLDEEGETLQTQLL